MDKTIKPLIIPIFIPHSGCPHQCAFCNQRIITSQHMTLPDKKAMDDIISTYSQYKGKRKSVELAFYGGNFLGLPFEKITHLLDIAASYIHTKEIDSIRFSTRPDTINKETLDLIKAYKISAIELGVQSMNDDILSKSKRGHTAEDTIKAVQMLKQYSIQTGAQVMVGLPGENENLLLESTRKLVMLRPDFVRIYPLMVLKGSLLEKWYNRGYYHPVTLEKSIDLVKKMVQIFTKQDVKVIRVGLQASDIMEDDSLVIDGPWHPAFGHLVFSGLIYDAACEEIDHYLAVQQPETLLLCVHPHSESRLRGNRNHNLVKLHERYPDLDFRIKRDKKMPVDQVMVMPEKS